MEKISNHNVVKLSTEQVLNMTSLRTYTQDNIQNKLCKRWLIIGSCIFISKLYGARSVETELREKLASTGVRRRSPPGQGHRESHSAKRPMRVRTWYNCPKKKNGIQLSYVSIACQLVVSTNYVYM